MNILAVLLQMELINNKGPSEINTRMNQIKEPTAKSRNASGRNQQMKSQSRTAHKKTHNIQKNNNIQETIQAMRIRGGVGDDEVLYFESSEEEEATARNNNTEG
jgi:hypothetical protein